MVHIIDIREYYKENHRNMELSRQQIFATMLFDQYTFVIIEDTVPINVHIMKLWCLEHLKGNVVYQPSITSDIWWFDNKQDAMLFKLKWMK